MGYLLERGLPAQNSVLRKKMNHVSEHVLVNEQIDSIETVLREVDQGLRERLMEIGVDLPYVMLAMGPNGSGVLRGNFNLALVRQLIEELESFASEAEGRLADDEAINGTKL